MLQLSRGATRAAKCGVVCLQLEAPADPTEAGGKEVGPTVKSALLDERWNRI